MVNYTSNLKTLGAAGTEYPDGYSYIEGEQPVDDWDNFVLSNVVDDIQHLVDVTNNDLLLRSGGVLQSNLEIGGYNLTGDAGLIDFGGTELGIDAQTDFKQSASFQSDVNVIGNLSESGNSVWHEGNFTPSNKADVTTVDSHTTDTTNPHSVTTSQIGAATSTEFSNHTSDTTNPHSVTTSQIGAATATEFDNHATHTSNPHSVTPSQIGARERVEYQTISDAESANLDPGTLVYIIDRDGMYYVNTE